MNRRHFLQGLASLIAMVSIPWRPDRQSVEWEAGPALITAGHGWWDLDGAIDSCLWHWENSDYPEPVVPMAFYSDTLTADEVREITWRMPPI